MVNVVTSPVSGFSPLVPVLRTSSWYGMSLPSDSPPTGFAETSTRAGRCWYFSCLVSVAVAVHSGEVSLASLAAAASTVTTLVKVARSVSPGAGSG